MLIERSSGVISPVILIYNKGVRMSDVEATDIYPLTVEEYETAATVAADVEVE